MAGNWKARLLWGSWIASVLLCLLSAAIVLQGLVRDHRIGEPVLDIEAASRGEWTAGFRVWGEGSYTLLLSAVSHDPQSVGTPLGARLAIEISDPDGKQRFERVYPPGATGLALPLNYGDTRLATLAVDGWPLRKWTMKARVLEPDPRFRGAHLQLKFWKDRPDVGMGGLVNYAMIVPAFGFFLAALGLAIALAMRGAVVPVAVTAVAGAAFLVFFLVGELR